MGVIGCITSWIVINMDNPTMVISFILQMGAMWGFAAVVWQFATAISRKNGQFARKNLARAYANSALLAIQMRVTGRANSLQRIIGINEDAIHVMELHAGSLPGETIEDVRRRWRTIRLHFIEPLEQNPENPTLLDDFENLTRSQVIEYVRREKIKEWHNIY